MPQPASPRVIDLALLASKPEHTLRRADMDGPCGFHTYGGGACVYCGEPAWRSVEARGMGRYD